MSTSQHVIGAGGSFLYVDKDGRKWNVSDIRDCTFTENHEIRRVNSMFHRDFSYYVSVGPPAFEMKITFSKLVIEEPEKKLQEIKSVPDLIRVIR